MEPRAWGRDLGSEDLAAGLGGLSEAEGGSQPPGRWDYTAGGGARREREEPETWGRSYRCCGVEPKAKNTGGPPGGGGYGYKVVGRAWGRRGGAKYQCYWCSERSRGASKAWGWAYSMEDRAWSMGVWPGGSECGWARWLTPVSRLATTP